MDNFSLIQPILQMNIISDKNFMFCTYKTFERNHLQHTSCTCKFIYENMTIKIKYQAIDINN